MNRRAVSKFLVLLSAALLLAPAGTCCLVAAPPVAAVTKAPSCPNCQRNAEKKSTGPTEKLPSRPRCCCELDRVSGNSDSHLLAKTPLAAAGVVSVVAIVANTNQANVSPAVCPELFPPGPSLQILQCVWRC